MTDERASPNKPLRICELLYIVLLLASAQLLVASRTGEARTVWEPMHPWFIPMLFTSTLVLFAILLTSEKSSIKLVLVILHSILLHSFFSATFPAGDTSGQQMYLGRIRFAFDNINYREWLPPSATSFPGTITYWLRGLNFQASLSTILARLFSVDIFWVHLFLVPVLWSCFMPVASYLITKTLGGSEKAATLSSLLLSAFPYATYFGAISTPNSLGFILFYYALYSVLRYLSSSTAKNALLMVGFSASSFLMHPLAGLVSFSLLVLALAFGSYQKDVASFPKKAPLIVVFLFCASLLPLSLTYLRFFGFSTNAFFTLEIIYESSTQEIIGLFLLGELIYGFDQKIVILVIIGPILALATMLYLIYRGNGNPEATARKLLLFMFAAFTLILIDYRVLRIFMSGLPLNEERLWVFRDLIAGPFVALGLSAMVSRLHAFGELSGSSTWKVLNLNKLSKAKSFRVLTIFVAVNVVAPFILSGWLTASLRAAYPEYAPLQVTSYELEAVKYLADNTTENYVVIGDLYTVYAGEMIVGIFNREAFFFGEFDKRREDLFQQMLNETTHQVLVEAMNHTNVETNLAYFIITKPRLGSEYDRVVKQAQQNSLQTFRVFYHPEGEEKLRVFFYKKTDA